MLINITEINWWSVLFAFLAYFLLGALWYMALFPKLYKVSLGKANEDLKNDSPLFIIGPAVCVLISVFANTFLIYALHIDSFSDAMLFAFIIGFGYLVANTTNIAINPNIPRPFLYSLITSSYHLVGTLISVMILVWHK